MIKLDCVGLRVGGGSRREVLMTILLLISRKDTKAKTVVSRSFDFCGRDSSLYK